VIAVLGSLVGVFYYFRVIITMFKEESDVVIPVNGIFKALLIVTSLAALVLGIFPQLLTGLL
jgi:NADH-quinone oxidoreductase subunit N